MHQNHFSKQFQAIIIEFGIKMMLKFSISKLVLKMAYSIMYKNAFESKYTKVYVLS